MARDPRRIKVFLGRFYSWYEQTYKATHPRFDNAQFWIAGAMLARFDSILGAGVGRSLNTKGLAEELAFQMLDSAAKSGVRMDWPTFSRSWKGLAVKVGIKAETIRASYGEKPKAKRGEEEDAVGSRNRDAGTAPPHSTDSHRPAQIACPPAASSSPSGTPARDSRKGRTVTPAGGVATLPKTETLVASPPPSRTAPSTELDFALSTWLLYRRNRKPKSDAELLEFHRTKCAELKREKVGAA